MLQVTGKVANCQLIIDVGLQPFLPKAQPVQSVPAPLAFRVELCKALIDTGAQLTCVTIKAVLTYGLSYFGKTMVRSARDERPHRVYLFYLGINCETNVVFDDVETTRSYYLLSQVQQAIQIPDNSQFDVIIGMNILSRCDFSITRHGDFTLTLP